MIVDSFTSLFEANCFLTRDHCGAWSSALMLIYIVSNGLITLAYSLIPLCLLIVWRKRRADIEFGWMLALFAAFITACGLTHLCDVVVFWWPGYRLFTLISAVAALLSVYAALFIPAVTRTLVQLPNPAMFRKVNLELEQALALKAAAIDESKGTIAALHRQVNHLERMRQTGLWVAEQESALRELKTVLDSSSVKEGLK